MHGSLPVRYLGDIPLVKLAIAAGHRESDSRRSGCRRQKPLTESYTIRLKTKPRFRLLPREAATKRSASSTQRETWVTKITDEHDVIVVGAGAAGIAATRRLIEAGVDVLLLEARNRVGGRALSVRQGNGAAIDLGCGWLHSADVNPWTDIGTALGFEIDRTLPPWQDEKHDLGMSLAQRRAFRTASTRFWKNFDANTAPISDQRAADYLEPGNPWNCLINATSTYINGAELDRVSALDFARYADTHINWRVPAGYGTLIARYSVGLPIVLDCKVVRIDHSGAAIRIETGGGVLRARTVIVTVPTNVLAAGAIRFTPDNPDTRDAAARLPLGHAEKVFLTLDDAADLWGPALWGGVGVLA